MSRKVTVAIAFVWVLSLVSVAVWAQDRTPMYQRFMRASLSEPSLRPRTSASNESQQCRQKTARLLASGW